MSQNTKFFKQQQKNMLLFISECKCHSKNNWFVYNWNLEQQTAEILIKVVKNVS